MQTSHHKPTPGLLRRLESLQVRHARLQAGLDAELNRPSPDTLTIQRLKRLKLKAKDEITAIMPILRMLGAPPALDAA